MTDSPTGPRLNRQQFLKGAAGAVGALGVMGAGLRLPGGAGGPEVAEAAPALSPAASRYLLQLSGDNVGFVHSFEGGDAEGEVVEEAVNTTTHYSKKHLAAVKYNDIRLAFDFNMGNALFQWIHNSWDAEYARMNGAIIGFDDKLAAQDQLLFLQALLTETTIPALDAGSKDPAFFEVALTPEQTQMMPPPSVVGDVALSKKQKTWLASNFRLQVGTGDGALDCSHVDNFEALVVKQKLTEDAIGEQRDYSREPAKLEFPNLVVRMPQSAAGDFYDWFEDFVIRGNSDDAHEKSGQLDFLAPDLSPLGGVTFSGLGIFKLAPEPSAASRVPMVVAHMYCEHMEFLVPAV